MSVTIKLRGDVSTAWTLANPIVGDRELAIETDTKRIKIGDGVSAWVDLAYAVSDRLQDSTDTTFLTLTDGDAIVYDAATNSFVNKNITNPIQMRLDGTTLYITDDGTPP